MKNGVLIRGRENKKLSGKLFFQYLEKAATDWKKSKNAMMELQGLRIFGVTLESWRSFTFLF